MRVYGIEKPFLPYFLAILMPSYKLLTEKVRLYSSLYPKLLILILEQMDIISSKNEKHGQKGRKSCTHIYSLHCQLRRQTTSFYYFLRIHSWLCFFTC